MANGTEAALIRGRTAVEVQAMKAEAAEQKRAEDLYNTLDTTTKKVLGEAWGLKIEQAQELRVQRAKRVNTMMKSAADYYRSRDSNSAAERLRSMLGLYKARLDNQVDLARIAYAPNLALVESLENKVPGLRDRTRDKREFARDMWAVVAAEARAKNPNAAALYDYVEGQVGPPTDAGFTSGDTVFQDLGEISQLRQQVFREAREFDAKAAFMAQGYEKWAAQNNESLSDPTSVDRYVQAMQLSAKDIPQAGSTFIQQLGQIAADPNNRQVALADIDAQIAQAEQAEKAAKEEFLGFGPKREKEPEPVPELTEYEKLVGWLSRPDVQEWAKRNGFNLGKVEDATPEILEGVRTGRYPQSMVVRGRVYTPAPDDMRAVRFAARQLEIDPQRNIFYRTGLAGERTRRGLTEITVADQPEVRVPVKALKAALTDDGQILVEGDDGKFYESKDYGETYALMTGDPVGIRGRFRQANPVEEAVEMGELPGVTRVQTPATTKTYTIQEQGLLYGRDPSGGVVGIDMTPGSRTFGERVQFTPEQVQRRTRIGAEAIAPTMVERSYLKEAQKAEKARQAEEVADIGTQLPAGTRQAPLKGAEALPRAPGVEVPEEAGIKRPGEMVLRMGQPRISQQPMPTFPAATEEELISVSERSGLQSDATRQAAREELARRRTAPVMPAAPTPAVPAPAVPAPAVPAPAVPAPAVPARLSRPMTPVEKRAADKAEAAAAGIFSGTGEEYEQAMGALAPPTPNQRAVFRAKLRGKAPVSAPEESPSASTP